MKAASTILIILFLCPAVVLAGKEVPAEKFKYNSYGRRDPFVPLVGIKERRGTGGVASILTVEDISLQGILTNPDGTKSVVINGDIMKEGDQIERLKVVQIGENSVKVELNDTNYDLKLYK